MAFAQRVCIAGSGGVAQALSVIVSSSGVPCNLWCDYEGHADQIAGSIVANSHLKVVYPDGATITGRPSKVCKDLNVAIQDCNVLILTTPPSLYARVLKEAAPHLPKGCFVCASPANGGFDLVAKDVLGERINDIVLVGILPLFPSPTRFVFGKEIHISAPPPICHVGALPESAMQDSCAIIHHMLKPREVHPLPHFLSCSLYPYPSSVDAVRLYAISHSDMGTPTSCPMFFEDMDEPSAGLIDLVNMELQAISDKINQICGIDPAIPHVVDYLGSIYGVQADSGSTRAFFNTCSQLKGIPSPMSPTDNGTLEPDLDHRVFHEDIPMGLCLFKGVAEIAQVETPIIDTIIEWAEGLLGKEYLVEGRLMGKDVAETHAPQRYGIRTLDALMGIKK